MAANALAATKQALIASLVQRELLNSASLLPIVSNLSNLATKGAKSISIPKLSSFTVQSRAFGAAASENSALTAGVDTIDLDKNKIILFGYDAHDNLQSTIEYKTEAIKRAAAAHGRQVNADIITELEAIAGLNLNTTTPADITIDDILDMRQFLMQNFADMSTARLVIAADQERAILELSEFSEYQYRGDGTAPVVTGMIGSVYGVPVVINQQVKAQQAFMVAPEGCGFAFQAAPAVAENTALKYGTGGMEVAVDQLYGVGGLQLGEGVALDNSTALGSTKSPLVAKLAD